MGRFNEEFAADQAAAQAAKESEGAEKAATMKVGNRCECSKGGKKRGEVMYVGQPEFAAGWWIGIKYVRNTMYNATLHRIQPFVCFVLFFC